VDVPHTFIAIAATAWCLLALPTSLLVGRWFRRLEELEDEAAQRPLSPTPGEHPDE
jgi:hypothetical protein